MPKVLTSLSDRGRCNRNNNSNSNNHATPLGRYELIALLETQASLVFLFLSAFLAVSKNSLRHVCAFLAIFVGTLIISYYLRWSDCACFATARRNRRIQMPTLFETRYYDIHTYVCVSRDAKKNIFIYFLPKKLYNNRSIKYSTKRLSLKALLLMLQIFFELYGIITSYEIRSGILPLIILFQESLIRYSGTNIVKFRNRFLSSAYHPKTFEETKYLSII